MPRAQTLCDDPMKHVQRILPLTDSEKEELLTHLIRSNTLRDAARDVLSPSHFDREVDGKYAVVWSAAVQLLEIHPPEILANGQALRNQCTRQLTGDTTFLSPEELVELYGDNVPDSLLRKPEPTLGFPDEGGADEDESEEGEADESEPGEDEADEDEPTRRGILDRILAADPADLNEARGRELLRRFLYERSICDPLRETVTDGYTIAPEQVGPMLDELQRRARDLNHLTAPPVGTLSEDWAEHDHWLEQFRGRELIGLKTGMNELDRRTCGLRGMDLLGAGPGVGKTALAINIAIGVCTEHAVNDAVVVVLSLEMDRNDILNRIKCNLGNIDDTTLLQGSPGHRDGPAARRASRQPQRNRRRANPRRVWFSQDDYRKLREAAARMRDEQIGARLKIFDRRQVGNNLTASGLVGTVKQFKESVGASRSLLIIDYLQVIGVPPEFESRGEIPADRWRVSMLQDYLGRMSASDQNDCVLVISEARKPSSAKELWGQGLAELMGTARLGYAADAVLLYGPMDHPELKQYYGLNNEDPEYMRNRRIEEGRAPIMLTLTKGRDGTQRGAWGLEFDFRRTRFHELTPRRSSAPCIPEDDTPSPDDAPDDNEPALPPAGRQRRRR